MKKQNRALKLLIVAMAMQVTLSCSTHKPETATTGSRDTNVRIENNHGSIYDISLTLNNQNGQRITWQSLRGKIQVMAMIFTHCQATCPIIMHQVKEVENRIPASLANRVSYTFISFDSKRDTSARLKAYYDMMRLNPRWQLLHANSEDVRTIASLLDVKFKEWPDSSFTHSNVIFVVDDGGRIVLRQEGIDIKNPDVIVNTIEALP